MGTHLALWDIDMTLLDLRGASRSWYEAALREVAGVAMTTMPAFAGRTERAIAVEMLRLHGISPDDATVEAMFAVLNRAAAEDAAGFAARGRTLPGAEAALSALRDEPAAVQTLITGNLRPIAAHKVGAFGLDAYLDLPLGGYGELSTRRADLVAAAVDRVTAAHGAPARVTVFGDAPGDIEAARAHGAVAVGLATGSFDRAALAAAGADHVLDDLTDTDRVRDLVLH